MAGKADAVLVFVFFLGVILVAVVGNIPSWLVWGIFIIVFASSILSDLGTVAFIWIVSLLGAWFAPDYIKAYSAAIASLTFFHADSQGYIQAGQGA